MTEIAPRISGARLGVTHREDQHAAVVAENEITTLAFRRVDNDRRLHVRFRNLGLKATGAQRRAACCDEQHQGIGHNGKGVSAPRRARGKRSRSGCAFMHVAGGYRAFRDPLAVFQNVKHERAVRFVRVGRSDARLRGRTDTVTADVLALQLNFDFIAFLVKKTEECPCGDIPHRVKKKHLTLRLRALQRR